MAMITTAMSPPIHVAPARRQRLHSLSALLLARVFALLLAVNVQQVISMAIEATPKLGLWRVISESVVHIACLLALIALLWFRRKVIATSAGLAVGRGFRLHMIPWQRVIDIREQPWVRISSFWSPTMWQVDLADGKSFDFAGVARAREIVTEFIQRS